MNLKSAAQGGVIVFSLLAAVFWLVAALRFVRPVDGDQDFRIVVDAEPGSKLTGTFDGPQDVLRTIQKQSFWNTLAALSACAGAVCQALAA